MGGGGGGGRGHSSWRRDLVLREAFFVRYTPGAQSALAPSWTEQPVAAPGAGQLKPLHDALPSAQSAWHAATSSVACTA